MFKDASTLFLALFTTIEAVYALRIALAKYLSPPYMLLVRILRGFWHSVNYKTNIKGESEKFDKKDRTEARLTLLIHLYYANRRRLSYKGYRYPYTVTVSTNKT